MSIKENILKLIDMLGINAFYRFINRSKDVCLMYHGIVPDNYPIESWLLVKEMQFKRQMDYLKKYWEVINIDSYIMGEFQTLKPKAIVTFDDGYQNNYTIAYPILKKLNIPATIYIVTDFIDRNELLWFDKVIYTIQRNALTSIDLSGHFNGLGKYHFSKDRKERWQGIEVLLTDIKKFGTTKVEEVAQTIFESVYPDTFHMSFFMPLTKQQVIEMAQSSIVEIGVHTAHHEILTDLTIAQAEMTISRSIEVVNEIIGKDPTHFCYPNGCYSERILALMQQFNFASAVTVINDFIDPKNFQKYEIPRIPVGAFDSINLFKAKVSGLQLFLS